MDAATHHGGLAEDVSQIQQLRCSELEALRLELAGERSRLATSEQAAHDASRRRERELAMLRKEARTLANRVSDAYREGEVEGVAAKRQLEEGQEALSEMCTEVLVAEAECEFAAAVRRRHVEEQSSARPLQSRQRLLSLPLLLEERDAVDVEVRQLQGELWEHSEQCDYLHSEAEELEAALEGKTCSLASYERRAREMQGELRMLLGQLRERHEESLRERLELEAAVASLEAASEVQRSRGSSCGSSHRAAASNARAASSGPSAREALSGSCQSLSSTQPWWEAMAPSAASTWTSTSARRRQRSPFRGSSPLAARTAPAAVSSAAAWPEPAPPVSEPAADDAYRDSGLVMGQAAADAAPLPAGDGGAATPASIQEPCRPSRRAVPGLSRDAAAVIAASSLHSPGMNSNGGLFHVGSPSAFLMEPAKYVGSVPASGQATPASSTGFRAPSLESVDLRDMMAASCASARSHGTSSVASSLRWQGGRPSSAAAAQPLHTSMAASRPQLPPDVRPQPPDVVMPTREGPARPAGQQRVVSEAAAPRQLEAALHRPPGVSGLPQQVMKTGAAAMSPNLLLDAAAPPRGVVWPTPPQQFAAAGPWPGAALSGYHLGSERGGQAAAMGMPTEGSASAFQVPPSPAPLGRLPNLRTPD
eukprot:TRINITY_DN38353_c0_g1_i2.p1 TRINITY_DN38353_c0_g1~~TRINITY_DN38353_c0_g1_i2.p1  ORF type:complete len:669 (-),score=170.82 TRINITY_DN38353_c0_g1_i2:56-2005(-)